MFKGMDRVSVGNRGSDWDGVGSRGMFKVSVRGKTGVRVSILAR